MPQNTTVRWALANSLANRTGLRGETFHLLIILLGVRMSFSSHSCPRSRTRSFGRPRTCRLKRPSILSGIRREGRRPIFRTGSTHAGLEWERPLRQSVILFARLILQHSRVGYHELEKQTDLLTRNSLIYQRGFLDGTYRIHHAGIGRHRP